MSGTIELAEIDDVRAGFLSWVIDGDVCEVLAVAADDRRRGVGTALIGAVEGQARAGGCRRMWLVTTDANVGAHAFYESLGYTLTERVRGGVDECRRAPRGPIPGRRRRTGSAPADRCRTGSPRASGRLRAAR
ncbi:MAG: GNAT family N-acetyltransferase [Acidimicrobiia bacterium]